MRRRDFLFAAVGSAGLLGASGLLDRASAYASILAEASAHVYTRRNVYCLTATSPEIMAYKKAIGLMRALPATNAVSWLAQANIHGAFGPPARMIANACQHNQTFFLSWHRMYVYFFERIVRKQFGTSSFALPYWGYAPAGRRDLPPMFRTPTAGNALYDGTRSAAINAGTPITASLVDSGAALAQTSFWNFTNTLNGTPHGAVHIACGGNMTQFATAGQDPIFWLHHCNIDRLWEVWLDSGGGRVDPTGDNTWMTTSFDFYDENGATVSLTGAQVVDIACQLRYQYENSLCGRRVVLDPDWWKHLTSLRLPAAAVTAKLDTLGRRPALPDSVLVAQSLAALRLGGKPVETTLPITDEGKARIAALERDPQGGARIDLVLDGVTVDGTPAAAYEIYIDLPAGAAADYRGPHFVGILNLFGASTRDAHQDKREAQIVPLTLAFLQLRAARLWSEDSVRVTFVPRGLTEGADPAKRLGAATPVTIGRVTVVVR
ncbi:MAG: hypothetical protein HOQ12_06860 [Gemmatimonadaceae bacterium]|nr:hypothetical protein [Gemmatimonadaceae bacterium]NUQ93808.1 hypothetical protein [Gemmatimonadaceae bacterium]NUR19237.1 hypothetical protein [Gemmatimonadaceae bacterium]